MLLHPTAVSLLSYLSKSRRWEPLDWLAVNPRLACGTPEFLPRLVEAGLVVLSETNRSARISISGMALAKMLLLRDHPFTRLVFAAGEADRREHRRRLSRSPLALPPRLGADEPGL
jgi:hypothetical protein